MKEPLSKRRSTQVRALSFSFSPPLKKKFSNVLDERKRERGRERERERGGEKEKESARACVERLRVTVTEFLNCGRATKLTYAN